MKGINRDVPVERYLHRADLSEISSSQAPLNEAPINSNEPALKGEVFLIFAGFIGMVLALSFCRRLLIRKPMGNKLGIFKHSQQIPCSNCRFYKNEPYLKCAVHPHQVLKKEAIDCPDYWPQDSNKFPDQPEALKVRLDKIKANKANLNLMNEDKHKNQYQKPWVRLSLLLLLPAIIFGLYIWSSRLALRKAPSVPIDSAPSSPSG